MCVIGYNFLGITVLTPRFMCLSSGRWWLVPCKKVRCLRSLRPLWTSMGPRRIQFEAFWIRDAGWGAYSTSWTGRGTVRRRDAGFRWGTFWTLLS